MTRAFSLQRLSIVVLATFMVAILSSCVDKIAMNLVADALTGDGSNQVFTGDNDPALVGDSLPFAIKMYESLLSANPTHPGLIRTTGSLYIMYANAFVAAPSDYLGVDKTDEKIAAGKRALNLYLRGRGILINGLENVYPGFRAAVLDGERKADLEPILAKMGKKDVPDLYWIAAGWFGALSEDNVNVALTMHMPNARACLDRAYTLDPDWGNGSLDELYIQVLASTPAEMGGSIEGARQHFNRALELSKGQSASAYIAFASTVLINQQKKAEFVEMMNKALEIDPDKDLERRLVNTLAQERARWYLKHLDDFFLE